MNWLERYVGHVKRYLPKPLRDDVGEEIRSLLQEKMSEAEEEKGGPLAEAETLSLLREFGHPLKVASAYQKHRVLVSESLFPIYKQVLKNVLLVFLTVYLIASVIEVSGVFEWWPAGANNGLESVVLWYFVIITVAFHFLDHVLSRIDFFGKWNPRRLPKIQASWANVPLASSIAAICFTMIWFTILTLLNNDYTWEILAGRSDNPLVSLILWLKLHAILTLAMNIHHLFRPYWTRLKLVFNLVTDFVGVYIVIRAMTAGDFVVQFLESHWGGNEADIQWAHLTIMVNLWIILLIAVGITGFNLYRLTKIRKI